MLVAAGCFTMQAKTLLGVLLKDHFPGMVLVEGKEEPEVARTWAHYVAQPDFQDTENVVYANKAERVVGEFWVSRFRTMHTLVKTNVMQNI